MSSLEIDTTSWFVVSTKPKQEFIAEQSLKSLGASTYLPLYLKRIKKRQGAHRDYHASFLWVSIRAVLRD